jgi:CDP-paratose 2-epimerase
MAKVLITGSGGLIGYECCKFFIERSWEVVGIDNNMRRYFFGEGGDTSGNIEYLKKLNGDFVNLDADIRDREGMFGVYRERGPFDLVIHTAAQPSHDWAKKEPLVDFDVNAVGTLNMLEGFRLLSPDGVFIFTSTNKVYGDAPNRVNLVELEKRYDYDPRQVMPGVSDEGISENMTIDDSTHSLFGASKAAADIVAQEYGRYFGLNVGVFRGGCLTGPQHSAVELHGYLAYIVDCAVKKKRYTVFGYKGKQVRDQIHSKDVASAFYEFYKAPRKGAFYNIGGCKQNAVSIVETIDILKKDFGLSLDCQYSETNRLGDHVCYYSDMSKFRRDYPGWRLEIGVREMIGEMVGDKSK